MSQTRFVRVWNKVCQTISCCLPLLLSEWFKSHILSFFLGRLRNMSTVFGVLYSILKWLIHVILCKYRHDQSGESIQSPCKTVFSLSKLILSLCMTKPTKWPVYPAKTQIRLYIHAGWLVSSLCAQWVAKDPAFLYADSEDSDQTGRMPSLIWVFVGCTSFCWLFHAAAHLVL